DRIDDLAAELRKCALVFPAGHGRYFEDGELQSFLETHEIPFIGPSAEACRIAFDKFAACQKLAQSKSSHWPMLLVDAGDDIPADVLARFVSDECQGEAIVKPCRSGSSIGVMTATSGEEAVACIEQLRSEGHQRVLVEPNAKAQR